jgi:hypothetical protein
MSPRLRAAARAETDRPLRSQDVSLICPHLWTIYCAPGEVDRWDRDSRRFAPGSLASFTLEFYEDEQGKRVFIDVLGAGYRMASANIMARMFRTERIACALWGVLALSACGGGGGKAVGTEGGPCYIRTIRNSSATKTSVPP